MKRDYMVKFTVSMDADAFLEFESDITRLLDDSYSAQKIRIEHN